MMIIICAIFSVHAVFADRHIRLSTYTLVRQRDGLSEFTAVGFIDEEPFVSYLSKNGLLNKGEWIKDKENDEYWISCREDMKNHQDNLNNTFAMVTKSYKHDRGIHTLQRMYACVLHDNGTTSAYDLYGYDGEDFITIHYNASKYMMSSAANDTAAEILRVWNGRGYYGYWKESLENHCIPDLHKTESNGNGTLKRKVRPEPLVFLNRTSSELVCHVTGFYPKSVTITWRKDGEDVYKDMELRDTLPNHNGTFQKRSLLKVPAEDLQKHNYTCVIQHSSLEKELVVVMEDTQLQIHNPGHTIPNISKGGEWRTVITLVITLIIAVGILIWKKKKFWKESYCRLVQKFSPYKPNFCEEVVEMNEVGTKNF